MIDWHSHILPGVDDGSRDVAESLLLVNMLTNQGVRTAIATPHFYANDQSVATFLERRQRALELLEASLPEGSPEILPGAEVRYYPGISRMQDLKSLRIEGSKLLLLEMPMGRWTEYMVRELVEMSGTGGIRIVLAHMERYLGLQSPRDRARIYDSGILMQVNASFLTSLATRHRAISLMRDGNIHFVGSDCHNVTSRPPQIGKAFQIMERRLGQEYISQMNEYGYAMLAEKNN